MQLEIGGGLRGKTGFVNLDQIPQADIQHNLNVVPWPVDDDSHESIYSSHCLEHLAEPHDALREICRIGRIGCRVEIRVPDGDAAMIPGHTFHLSEVWWRNLCEFLPQSFPHESRILRIESLTRNPNHMTWLVAKKAFPHLTDQEVMIACPRAAFELVIVGTVEARK